MNLILIAALARNRVIGKSGEIPWKIPEDMKRFKELTSNHPVIMGRKTYEGILKKLGTPLRNRQNIVLTSGDLKDPGIYVARDINDALWIAQSFDREAFIIGGETIYEETINLANRMELTEIHRNYEGDAYFPDFEKKEWQELSRKPGEYNEIKYDFVTYSRK